METKLVAILNNYTCKSHLKQDLISSELEYLIPVFEEIRTNGHSSIQLDEWQVIDFEIAVDIIINKYN